MEDVKSDQAHKAEHAEKASKPEETRAPSVVSKDPTQEEHPPSAQQAHQAPELDRLEPGQSEADDSEDDVDPADQIMDFDWDELHERYHQTINNASAQEQELMQEFAQLMEVLLAYTLVYTQGANNGCSTSKSGLMLAPIKSLIAPSTGMHAPCCFQSAQLTSI
jgi:hypothetical protein